MTKREGTSVKYFKINTLDFVKASLFICLISFFYVGVSYILFFSSAWKD